VVSQLVSQSAVSSRLFIFSFAEIAVSMPVWLVVLHQTSKTRNMRNLLFHSPEFLVFYLKSSVCIV